MVLEIARFSDNFKAAGRRFDSCRVRGGRRVKAFHPRIWSPICSRASVCRAARACCELRG